MPSPLSISTPTDTPTATPQVLGRASPCGWRQERRAHGLVMPSARPQQTSSSAIVCPRLKQPTQAQTQSQNAAGRHSTYCLPEPYWSTQLRDQTQDPGQAFSSDCPDASPILQGEPRTPPSRRQTFPCGPLAWTVWHKPSNSTTIRYASVYIYHNTHLLQATAISGMCAHQ